MKYTGRITSFTITLVAFIGIRLYAYIYFGFPLTTPPIIGLCFLILAFSAGKQYDKVKFYSEKDSLTGCYNRRFVDMSFPKLLAQLNQKNEKLSLAILDCDNFKAINDRYGHKKGDLVLQEVSALLLKQMRKNDMVARWGGDEFLIIAPYTDHRELVTLVYRFEQELEKLSQQLHIGIAVSSGVATYPSDAKQIDDLIHIADLNMYHFKNKKQKIGSRLQCM